MKTLKVLSKLWLAGVMVFFAGCERDEIKVTTGPIFLGDIMVNGTLDNGEDISMALTPGQARVPLDAAITIDFTKALDEATASSIKLVHEDGTPIDASVSVEGSSVLVTPSSTLEIGKYILTLGPGLKAADGGVFLNETSRSFSTVGVIFLPEGQIAHWNFEDNAEDQTGVLDAVIETDIAYVAGRSSVAGKAASFNGTTSIIEIPDGDQLMSHGDFALSFWMKVNGNSGRTGEGHFVMGLAAWMGFHFEILGSGDTGWSNLGKGVKITTRYNLGETSGGEDTWWNGNPNGWQGSLFAKDVSGSGGIATYFKDKWAHVVCTYDKTTKVGAMYVNGERTRAWDFDLWPDGSAKRDATGVKYDGNTTGGGNNLALGFIQASGNRIVTDDWADPSNPANSHFKGELDDIRVFSRAIGADEALELYNSEKP